MAVFRTQRRIGQPTEGVYADFVSSEIINASGTGNAQPATGAGNAEIIAEVITASGTGNAQPATGAGNAEIIAEVVTATGVGNAQPATGAGTAAVSVFASGVGNAQNATGIGSTAGVATASGVGNAQNATGSGFLDDDPLVPPFDIKLAGPRGEILDVNHHDTLMNVLPDSHDWWQGLWVPREYLKGHVVNDDNWLMIANKTTSDRAAPIPVGPETPIYGTTPTWTINQYEGHIYSVLELQAPNTGLFEIVEASVWVQGITDDDQYQLLLRDNDTGIFEEIISFQGSLVGEPQFVTIPIDGEFIQAGAFYTIWLHQWATTGSDITTAPWTRAPDSNQNVDPGAGNWGTRGSGTDVRISYIDDDGTDRTALLQDPGLIGSTLVMQQQSDTNRALFFTINGITDSGTHVFYDTTRTGTGAGGEPVFGALCNIEFQVPILAITEYVTVPGYLAPFPAFSSRIVLDNPLGPSVPVQDGVGINLTFQEYEQSFDWDFMAVSGGSGGGGGGGLSPHNLDYHTDVTITNPQEEMTLTYRNGQWINATKIDDAPGSRFIKLTQAEYDALGPGRDTNIQYIVVG